MQTYLCSNCKQKVPRSQLLEHRKTCGVHADLSLQKGISGSFLRILKTLFMVLLIAGLSFLSLFLGKQSFQSLANMRQLERIPPSSVRAALEGEINLNGSAEKHQRLLSSPNTGTPCLYYRYVVKVKEKDSDGDTTWRTIQDDTVFVPFQLTDPTGSILIKPDGDVDFAVKESWSDRRGDYSYTEYRLEPGEPVFVFGYAERTEDTFSVNFSDAGHYQPIISEYGETRERIGMAGGSIALCWVGLVVLAVALSFLISIFRVHRLLVYFSILNLIIALYLVILGLNMMKADLKAAVDRLGQHTQTTQGEVADTLKRIQVEWDGNWDALPDFSFYSKYGLGDETILRLEELRLNLANATDRVRTQRSAFPEWILAPLWGIPKPAPLPLPHAQRDRLNESGTGLEKAKIPPLIGLGIIAVSLIAGIITFIFGFRKISFKRCMENLPTSPTSGAVYGLNEFKGVVDIAKSADFLTGPVSHQPCVQYHYHVSEKRGTGKNAKWVTLIDQTRTMPFLCKDGDGEVLIDPAGAKIYSTHRSNRREGRRRYTETRLAIGDPLYAIGECTLNPSTGESLYLKKPEGTYPFILSNFTEQQVMLKIAKWGILLLDASFAALLLMGLLLFGLSGSFAATDYLAAALIAPFFMTAVTLMLHYNDLIFLRNRVTRNRSNIDVSLKKRHDLVPQLQQVAEALMSHEREVQEAITDMRKSYAENLSDQPGALSEHMKSEHNALNRLLLVSEDYPDLISNTNTAILMRTLITLENEISLMRSGYNDAVETYNTRILSFPDVFFAKLFHFEEESLVFDETGVVGIPPRIQDLWEQDQIEKTRLKTGDMPEETADPQPETEAEASPTTDLPAGPAVLAAASGGNAGQDQPEIVESFLGIISAEPEDNLTALKTAEALYPQIRELSPSDYRGFRARVIECVEEDSIITVFEYALLKSMSRHLDPAFGLKTERPMRHRNLESLIEPVSTLLSQLAAAEETPDTVQAAFDTGVQNLNHRPLDDFERIQVDAQNLADIDPVLEEIAHAAPMIKANVLYACEALVKMNDDATTDQMLLLYAIADTLDRDRPDWI